MRKSSRIRFWEGTTLSLWDGLTLINCGGHFEGGAVLHWQAGANGKGALLTGDIIQVVQDRRYASFMRSYPNLIPLGGRPRSNVFSKGSNHSHSNETTARGGKRTFSQMQKRRCAVQPSGNVLVREPISTRVSPVNGAPRHLGKTFHVHEPQSGGEWSPVCLRTMIGRVWDISPNRWQKDAYRSATIVELPRSATVIGRGCEEALRSFLQQTD